MFPGKKSACSRNMRVLRLRVEVSQRLLQGHVEHVSVVSHASHSTHGVRVALESGPVRQRSRKIIRQAYIPCRVLRRPKACVGRYSRAQPGVNKRSEVER